MHEQKLSAGVIGLGVGEAHISGYEVDPRCTVASLCDIDEKKLKEVGSRYPGRKLTNDAEELLSDPTIDVVSIASYDTYHHEQIMQALKNGKHVFVEKPLCLFEKELNEIFSQLNKSRDLKLSSNLILRSTPRFLELQQRIQSNELGDVYYLEGDYDYGRLGKIVDGWRGSIPYYSVVHGGAIHLIDLILWLTEKKVCKVVAMGNKTVTKQTKFRRQDLVVALLEFEDGALAKISANFGCMVPHHHKLSVYGTRGTFEQSHTGAAYFFSRDPAVSSKGIESEYPGSSKGDMLPSFVKHILDGDTPDVTSQEVLDAMSISLAVEKSLGSGRPESVNYLELQ
jgi:predicted dehydrogenase